MKTKYTDEQLLELLRNPQYKNNKQVADALGTKSYGGLNNRLNQLRKVNGLPESGGKSGKKSAEPLKPLGQKPRSAPSGLRFEDIKPGTDVLRNGMQVRVVGAGKDKIALRVKGPGDETRTEIIERKNFDLDLWEAAPGETVAVKPIEVNGGVSL